LVYGFVAAKGRHVNGTASIKPLTIKLANLIRLIDFLHALGFCSERPMPACFQIPTATAIIFTGTDTSAFDLILGR
jgi:hypothetical protein